MRLGLAGLLICVAATMMPHVAAQAVDSKKQSAEPTIVYRNAQYGFCFVLPESWEGYTVLEDKWEGSPLDGGNEVDGPVVRIRHPKWTEPNPYEDIPIMVFTRAEWGRIEREGMAVSAAPIGPTELGRTHQFVFALPARYNFDDAKGAEDVDKLIHGGSLIAPCSTKELQR